MRRYVVLLALLPTVAHAEPTTVILILNYHYVTPEVFVIDVKGQNKTITQEQLDKMYVGFLTLNN